MLRTLPIVCLALLAAVAPAQPADDALGLWCFAPERREAQHATETALQEAIDPERLAQWHEMVTRRPRPAGAVGDRAMIQTLATELTRMGLDVTVQRFEALVSLPVRAHLELVTPDGRTTLPVAETPIDSDPDTASEEIPPGFNAYAATGDVTAPFVFANYATWQDFERLEEMGVEVEGKIVLARYGRNYRGYKAKFAEEAGAVGLVIFTDPRDSGHLRGPVYPEGGWANEESIQRGSILTLDHPGDPLTPGEFAGPDALRPLDVNEGLPTIPVQPIGYAAAEPILRAMAGDVAPGDWQGGIDTPYRLTSGDDNRLRIDIEQERTIVETANVIATIVGDEEPHFEVIAGCHHDAWTHGASDPGAGLIVLLELARVFGEHARLGDVPDRTIRFAFWGAEEHGIIGSTEFVESRERALRLAGVAYLNLDMAAMGTRFGASASPSLAGLIRDATHSVENLEGDGTIYDDWGGDSDDEPSVGSMGGGSDHVAFLARAGVPCMAIGMRGAEGVAYHSAHDTLAWYRKVVGDDYKTAASITRVGALLLSRLANADVLPLEPWAYAEASRRVHEELTDAMQALDPRACVRLHSAWVTWRDIRETFQRCAQLVLAGEIDPQVLNAPLMRCDRAWIERETRGLPGRDWYRNHFAAPDERSGYRAWILPGLRAALARGDAEMLRRMALAVEGAARKAEAAALSAKLSAERITGESLDVDANGQPRD